METVTLIDLPWEDIVFRSILFRLNLKDLFNLRSVSKHYKVLIESYFNVCTDINLALHKGFQRRNFRILTTYCRNVKKINVSRCNWLSDEIFRRLLSKNPHIVEINLSCCNVTSVGTKSLQTLISNCKNLKILQMYCCDWLTTEVVDAMTNHLEKLEFVDFTKCVLLSERCLLNFVIKFNRLKYLSLAGIPSLSDNVVVTIADHCLELEKLDINNCPISIKALSLLILIDKCKNLKSVNISGRMLTRNTTPYYQ